jgi:hypothetical protein
MNKIKNNRGENGLRFYQRPVLVSFFIFFYYS